MAAYTILGLGCYVGVGITLIVFLGLWIGVPKYYFPDATDMVCFASPFIIW
jgi:hypothetical protein|tara:strand:+ start:157 stop:309 length:153 start_codon:yes stop_codon:yes gene_type:complete